MTVSRKATEGSATLISTSPYTCRKSCKTQSKYNSPVPNKTCSPDSSTRVWTIGYALLTPRKPWIIFGNSAGFNGSNAIFIVASPPAKGKDRGVKICTNSVSSAPVSLSPLPLPSLSPSPSFLLLRILLVPTIVAVLAMVASTPLNKTQFPAVAIVTGVLERPRGMEIDSMVATAISSSSSSGEYPSPNTFTRCPGAQVPE
mmetsp:Transcript_1452/g.1666  ORF Transcript_1452/g.1666 Transcript_1452/m.1666 type:complete len:201 (-) Transcript_1452:1881-2483(-)